MKNRLQALLYKSIENTNKDEKIDLKDLKEKYSFVQDLYGLVSTMLPREQNLARDETGQYESLLKNIRHLMDNLNKLPEGSRIKVTSLEFDNNISCTVYSDVDYIELYGVHWFIPNKLKGWDYLSEKFIALLEQNEIANQLLIKIRGVDIKVSIEYMSSDIVFDFFSSRYNHSEQSSKRMLNEMSYLISNIKMTPKDSLVVLTKISFEFYFYEVYTDLDNTVLYGVISNR